ncbi:MAG: methylmalonyl-CoA mutase family protein [Henriciella sp.]|nr:methylmalonyl-CoA mutase family protein [Henriciella sp.]
MPSDLLPLSSGFETATEADWLAAVTKALKGGGIDRITRETRDGIAIKPLYRETDFPSAQDVRGAPGEPPFLRSAVAEPDAYLPWDIRQVFTHPNPAVTNAEILRDLERGVSSVLLSLDCSGQAGCVIGNAADLATALQGVRADLATIALAHRGAGSGVSASALLAEWAAKQDNPEAQKLAFNISPITQLIRTGIVEGGLDQAFERTAAFIKRVVDPFPLSTSLMSEALTTHEAGGTEAQELGVLMAHAVDTLRRLDAAGLAPSEAANQIQFMASTDANYGLGIAKLRTARRLWARVQDALDLPAAPMKLHAVTSARMLTKYDPWVNMLRGSAACFAAAIGGADAITVRSFNSPLGIPEELGRRIARNTQIIAMEESGLGRVSDPSGGAWFTETLSEDLAVAAWSEFQQIEAEGGLTESLIAGHLQARIAEKRAALMKAVSRRKVPITGVSEFPLLEGVDAPVANVAPYQKGDSIDPAPLTALIGDIGAPGEDASADALPRISLAEPFETLRDRAETHFRKTGARPSIYLATLGPLAEHNARADFARNLFAAGGIEAVDADSFSASGCTIAVICGSDTRYEAEAADVANALKQMGAARVWLAGKFEADSIDSHIKMGCDVVHECTLALAELGVG